MVASDSGDNRGDILDWTGNKSVVAVLGLLQLDQLGVSRGVSLDRLEGGGLVGEGLLDGGWHGVGDGVGVPKTIGIADQLGSGLGRGENYGQHNQELHSGEIL